jgi:hypothetical protein
VEAESVASISEDQGAVRWKLHHFSNKEIFCLFGTPGPRLKFYTTVPTSPKSRLVSVAAEQRFFTGEISPEGEFFLPLAYFWRNLDPKKNSCRQKFIHLTFFIHFQGFHRTAG